MGGVLVQAADVQLVAISENDLTRQRGQPKVYALGSVLFRLKDKPVDCYRFHAQQVSVGVTLRASGAHAALKERLAQKPGWDYEPKLAREGEPPLKPDVGTPKRNPQFADKRKYIELKPDSPSGRAAGARALKRYQEVTKDPVRLLFYSLKDFI